MWGASRGWTIAWLVLLVVQGFLPAATVYLTGVLVDSTAAVISGDGALLGFRSLLLQGALMLGLLLLQQMLASLTGWVRSAQGELVRDHVSSLIHEKSLELDLAFYDSPEYYDHLHRARSEASARSVMLLEGLGGLLQGGITLVAMVKILLPYGTWLPFILIISTLPALYVVASSNSRQHRYWMRATPDHRRTWYYDWVLTARETAAELRLSGSAGQFQEAFRSLRERLRAEQLRLHRNAAIGRLAAGAFALLGMASVMAIMLWRANQGEATIGDLALFYAAFNQGQGLSRSLLENVGQTYGNSLFLNDLFEFLELEPKIVDPPAAIAIPDRPARGPAIRFEGVTFAYPGSKNGRKVLQGLGLEIASGEVAAIVGPNGTGKTTLLKLLCRFYDPQVGRVTLDGVNIRDLSLDELRRSITVLFQEPVHYNASAAENITIGNGTHSAEEIQAAARAAGADGPIERLPQGYDTQLGTWFAGGTDLSVGEWQRIALARAFLRQAPLIILDEPTSAMDSWAEADWLGRFRALVAGRTALMITHRFTTARFADVIHVMDGGRIVESGSHGELLALGGRYAQSWRAQMAPQGAAIPNERSHE